MKKFIIFVIKLFDNLIVKVSYFFTKKSCEFPEKSILVFVSQLRNGGAERVAANIADEFSKKYKTILVTYSSPTKEDYSCGVERIVIDENKSKFFRNYYVVKNLRKIKRKYHITHSISFCSRANYLNVMSKVGDKTIISIRSYLKYSELDQLYRKLNEVAGKYCDLSVVVSKQLIEEQVEEYHSTYDKNKVIYNFLDTKKIDDSLNEKNNIKLSRNTIINIGRLSSQKGQIYLIRSFQKVVEVVPDAKLIILGQGELKEKLQKEIKELKLSKNVKLLGFKKNPYVYMKKSSIYVSSSFFEGMSNSLLEAMYLGLPIITTDCISGMREIIAPNTDINIRNKKICYR